MAIEFRCSQCGKLLRTGDDTAGRMAQCPECGSQTPIPFSTEPELIKPTSIEPPQAGAAGGTPFGGSAYDSTSGENPYQPPRQPVPVHDPNDKKSQATASLTLGISGLVMACCCPLLGVVLSVIGLIFGIIGLQSRNRGVAVAGIICSSLGILFGVLNAIAGAMMGMQGRHPFIRRF